MKLPSPLRLAAFAAAAVPSVVLADRPVPPPESPVRVAGITATASVMPLYAGVEVMPVDPSTRGLFKLPETVLWELLATFY